MADHDVARAMSREQQQCSQRNTDLLTVRNDDLALTSLTETRPCQLSMRSSDTMDQTSDQSTSSFGGSVIEEIGSERISEGEVVRTRLTPIGDLDAKRGINGTRHREQDRTLLHHDNGASIIRGTLQQARPDVIPISNESGSHHVIRQYLVGTRRGTAQPTARYC